MLDSLNSKYLFLLDCSCFWRLLKGDQLILRRPTLDSRRLFLAIQLTSVSYIPCSFRNSLQQYHPWPFREGSLWNRAGSSGPWHCMSQKTRILQGWPRFPANLFNYLCVSFSYCDCRRTKKVRSRRNMPVLAEAKYAELKAECVEWSTGWSTLWIPYTLKSRPIAARIFFFLCSIRSMQPGPGADWRKCPQGPRELRNHQGRADDLDRFRGSVFFPSRFIQNHFRTSAARRIKTLCTCRCACCCMDPVEVNKLQRHPLTSMGLSVY